MDSLLAVLVVSTFVAGSAVITDQFDQSKLVRTVRRHNDAVQIGALGDSAVGEEGEEGEEGEAVQIGALGDTAVDAVQIGALGDTAVDAVQIGALGDTTVIAEPTQQSKLEGFTKMADLCNVHFLEGVEKSNDCADPAHEVVIEGEAMCRSAAALTSGIGCTDKAMSCLGEPMEITSEFFNIHPMRCYIDNGKWHYNPSGYMPTNITGGGGTPICRVPELHEGNRDSNDCHDTASYENILNETECRAADTCMGACLNENFRVSDDDSPKGCHNATNGCIRFNYIGTTPTGPKGTPICKHKSGNIATKLTSTMLR